MGKSFLILASFLLLTSSTFAKLGDNEASVELDIKSLSCEKGKSLVHPNFKVIEMQCDFGQVREFIALNKNSVFAISWSGISHPDLTILLGIYFSENHEAIEKVFSRARTQNQQVKTSSLILEKWGRSKNLGGRAYDPTLVPAEVKIDEIQ